MQTSSLRRFVVLLVSVMVVLAVAAPAQTVVSISSVTTGVKVGSQITVSVTIANAPPFALYHTIVGYDANVLELTEMQFGSFFKAVDMISMVPGFPSNPQDVDASLKSGKTASGSGTLYTLTFTAKALGASPITFTELALRDVSNEDVPSSGVNGLIVVDTPLPIQISSLTATWMNAQGVVLTWRTASEINNYGFEVQRSQTKESPFVTIPGSFQEGQGTSLEQHTYSYVDNTAGIGIWYYRLRQIDLDGTEHFTEPVQVEVTTSVKNGVPPLGFALEQNFPNPFNPATTIQYTVAGARGQGSGVSFVRLTVCDELGREVATLVNAQQAPGTYTVRWNANGLATGLYYCRLTAGDFAATKAMLFQK